MTTRQQPEQEQSEGEYLPTCPTCGDKATFRDAMGRFWDSSGHHWKETFDDTDEG